ncbi:MAG: YhcH/YjgK/YiaL family protein [Clostridia bacterium]|nr:YhcH/YjgK/YiaL family protein [Clostridia bacterium]
MVIDKLKNKNLYADMHPLFKKAFDFLENAVEKLPEEGRYDIDGDNVYAMVQSYETKEKGLPEAHDKYIDIQLVVKGCEKIEYSSRDGLEIEKDYVEDVVFFKENSNSSSLILDDNTFAVFYPCDAHTPGLIADKKQNVTKIVVKVKVL